ncbi:hypothetical protein [Lentibacillus sp. JNUCC-1]|uniref:hypothetical protein n=1 Tax=Lentibacillus sp. JNUCC-1 TaxID=2654513 RepID=UPI0012E6F11B|nr:hypothetical protein [Lentibacillus sp. JNUCC-1]
MRNHFGTIAVAVAMGLLLSACGDNSSDPAAIPNDDQATQEDTEENETADDQDAAPENSDSNTTNAASENQNNNTNTEDTTQSEEAQVQGDEETSDGYKTYQNPRFGFAIEYPSSFEADYMPDNGDGIEVHDESAVIIASGSHMGYGGTPISDLDAIKPIYEDELADLKADNHSIGYKKLADDWYVLSYVDGDNIVYKKSLMADDYIVKLSIEYPEDRQDDYESVVERVSNSLRTLPNSIKNP